MTLTRENCTFTSRLSLIARDDRGSSITTRHDILARKALEKSYITLVKYNTRAKQLASYEELLARRWVIHASVLHASVKFKSSGTVYSPCTDHHTYSILSVTCTLFTYNTLSDVYQPYHSGVARCMPCI